MPFAFFELKLNGPDPFENIECEETLTPGGEIFHLNPILYTDHKLRVFVDQSDTSFRGRGCVIA